MDYQNMAISHFLKKVAYWLFTVLGLCILAITLFEISVGREEFLFGIAVLPVLPIFITLIAISLIAVLLSFVVGREDGRLLTLALVTIPYSVFALNNLFFFYDPLVFANKTVEFVSILYSIACLAVGLIGIFLSPKRA